MLGLRDLAALAAAAVAVAQTTAAEQLQIPTKQSAVDRSMVCLDFPSTASVTWQDALLDRLGNNATVRDEWVAEMDSNGCYPRLFAATPAFRPVLPGQNIEAGLYVRMDMSRGLRWARLDVPVDGGDSAVVPAVDPLEEPETFNETQPPSDNHTEPRILSKPASDTTSKRIGWHERDVFQGLVQLLNVSAADPQGAENLTRAMDVLEQLSHDVDYALLFLQVDRGWELLAELAEAGPDEVPEAAARGAAVVIGNLVQNNPAVHAAALQRGMAPRLVAQLKRLMAKAHVADDEAIARASAVSYAVSSLLRQSLAALTGCLEQGCESLPRIFTLASACAASHVLEAAGPPEEQTSENPTGLNAERCRQIAARTGPQLVGDWARRGMLYDTACDAPRARLQRLWCHAEIPAAREALLALHGVMEALGSGLVGTDDLGAGIAEYCDSVRAACPETARDEADPVRQPEDEL